jgi:hypothetical protein
MALRSHCSNLQPTTRGAGVEKAGKLVIVYLLNPSFLHESAFGQFCERRLIPGDPLAVLCRRMGAATLVQIVPEIGHFHDPGQPMGPQPLDVRIVIFAGSLR